LSSYSETVSHGVLVKVKLNRRFYWKFRIWGLALCFGSSDAYNVVGSGKIVGFGFADLIDEDISTKGLTEEIRHI